jgi:hypothetical protein
MPAWVTVEIDGQLVELDRDEENHPACKLLSAWDKEAIPTLLVLAEKWGVVIWDEGSGTPLRHS